jgi:hypothetical protein
MTNNKSTDNARNPSRQGEDRDDQQGSTSSVQNCQGWKDHAQYGSL